MLIEMVILFTIHYYIHYPIKAHPKLNQIPAALQFRATSFLIGYRIQREINSNYPTASLNCEDNTTGTGI